MTDLNLTVQDDNTEGPFLADVLLFTRGFLTDYTWHLQPKSLRPSDLERLNRAFECLYQESHHRGFVSSSALLILPSHLGFYIVLFEVSGRSDAQNRPIAELIGTWVPTPETAVRILPLVEHWKGHFSFFYRDADSLSQRLDRGEPFEGSTGTGFSTDTLQLWNHKAIQDTLRRIDWQNPPLALLTAMDSASIKRHFQDFDCVVLGRDAAPASPKPPIRPEPDLPKRDEPTRPSPRNVWNVVFLWVFLSAMLGNSVWTYVQLGDQKQQLREQNREIEKLKLTVETQVYSQTEGSSSVPADPSGTGPNP